MRFATLTRRALAVGAAAIAATGLAGTPAQAEDPIKIGTFLSVTGPASFLGDPQIKTLEHFVAQMNEDGGILGRQVELVYYDVGVDADQARTAVKRLIEQDEVDAIIGGTTSGQTMAVIPLVERAGIPFISFAGAIQIVDPVNPFVFKTPHTDRQACIKIFEDMVARGLTNVGLISGTGGFGKSMRDQCLDVAGEQGITIVADETYGPSDSDMTAQLTNIRGVEGLDAVLNAGFGQGPAIVTRNYTQLGIDVPLYQSHGVASKGFIELAGEAAEGVRLPAVPVLIADQLADDDPQKDVVTTYVTAYEAAFESDVSSFGGYAYDGLLLIANAFEQAGSTDKQAVRDALEATTGLIGVSGIFNMSADDHLGLAVDSFRMVEIQDGGWVLVE